MKVLSALILFAFFSAAAAADGPPFATEGGISGDIYFDRGGSALGAEAKKAVKDIYEWAKARPGAAVMLAGYDEQRTPEKESVELGWARARAVQAALVSLGMDARRINTISFGNTRVAVQGQGEAVWSKNRRVRYRAVDAGGEGMGRMPAGVCQRCKLK